MVVYGQDNGTFTTYECFVSVETEEVLYRSYDVMITETGIVKLQFVILDNCKSSYLKIFQPTMMNFFGFNFFFNVFLYCSNHISVIIFCNHSPLEY